MMNRLYWNIIIGLFFFYGVTLAGQTVNSKIGLSTIKEVKGSIRRGILFLKSGQDVNGSWSQSPEITALCLLSIYQNSTVSFKDAEPSLFQARSYLESFVIDKIDKAHEVESPDQPSTIILWLLASFLVENSSDELFLGKIKQFFVRSQDILGQNGKVESPLLSKDNLSSAVEPFAVSPNAMPLHGFYLESCIFSFSGISGLFLCGMETNHLKIKSRVEWIKRNCFFEEPLKRGTAGFYSYYYGVSSMFKYLKKNKKLTEASAKKDIDFLVIRELLSCQRGNGSWVNENGIWSENNPYLATAYAVLTFLNIVL